VCTAFQNTGKHNLYLARIGSSFFLSAFSFSLYLFYLSISPADTCLLYSPCQKLWPPLLLEWPTLRTYFGNGCNSPSWPYREVLFSPSLTKCFETVLGCTWAFATFYVLFLALCTYCISQDRPKVCLSFNTPKIIIRAMLINWITCTWIVKWITGRSYGVIHSTFSYNHHNWGKDLWTAVTFSQNRTHCLAFRSFCCGTHELSSTVYCFTQTTYRWMNQQARYFLNMRSLAHISSLNDWCCRFTTTPSRPSKADVLLRESWEGCQTAFTREIERRIERHIVL